MSKVLAHPVPSACRPPQMLLGATANAVGNLVYAFTVLANRWWIMIIARCARGAAALVHARGAPGGTCAGLQALGPRLTLPPSP